MVNTLMKFIRQSKAVLVNFYQQHSLLSIFAGLTLLGLAIYSNQQAFLNLWLTRDQQAMLAFEQGDMTKAAQTFSDENWVAYSYYLNADFEQAAQLYDQFDGVHARFAQANALAHAGQYIKAKGLYQAVIEIQPQHQAQYQQVLDNIELMESLIKKMKKSPGKKKLSTEIAENSAMLTADKKTKVKVSVPSDNLWLKQVQQNPSKFLKNKFQQEYSNENK